MYFSVLPIWMFLSSLTLIIWKMQFEVFYWNFHKILNKKQLKYMSIICVLTIPLSFEHWVCNAHSLGMQTTRSGQNTTYIKNLFTNWPKWLLNMKIQTFWHTKNKKSEKFWSHQKLPSEQLCSLPLSWGTLASSLTLESVGVVIYLIVVSCRLEHIWISFLVLQSLEYCFFCRCPKCVFCLFCWP